MFDTLTRKPKKKDDPVPDLSKRNVRIIMRLMAEPLAKSSFRITGDQGAQLDDLSVIVYVVKTAMGWTASAVHMAKEGEKSKGSRLVIYSPFGEDTSKDLERLVKAEVAKRCDLVDDQRLVLYTWAVQSCHSPSDSGLHAVCHGLSLVSRGHPWLGDLSAYSIIAVRHCFLRLTTKTFSEAFRTREANSE